MEITHNDIFTSNIAAVKLVFDNRKYSEITRGLQAHPFIFAQPAFRVLLHNKAHLKMLIEAIINDSGEGVIAQQDARYEYGRARGLAKIKVCKTC